MRLCDYIFNLDLSCGLVVRSSSSCCARRSLVCSVARGLRCMQQEDKLVKAWCSSSLKNLFASYHDQSLSLLTSCVIFKISYNEWLTVVVLVSTCGWIANARSSRRMVVLELEQVIASRLVLVRICRGGVCSRYTVQVTSKIHQANEQAYAIHTLLSQKHLFQQ